MMMGGWMLTKGDETVSSRLRASFRMKMSKEEKNSKFKLNIQFEK